MIIIIIIKKSNENLTKDVDEYYDMRREKKKKIQNGRLFLYINNNDIL